MTADSINGAFEAIGAAFALLNVRRLYKDGSVKGTSLWTAGFFCAWGLWNLFYYPFLGQMWSMLGGVFLASFNCMWLTLAIIYCRKPVPKYKMMNYGISLGKSVSPALQLLIDEARFYRMSDEEKEAQRQGFASANVALDKDPKGRTVPIVTVDGHKLKPGESITLMPGPHTVGYVPCQEPPNYIRGENPDAYCERDGDPNYRTARIPMPGAELPPSCKEPRYCDNPACCVTGFCQEMMLGRMGV